MRDRCTNPRHHAYALYGGRGIAVCARWESFENFLADMGERPAGTSLDRYPNKDGNYEPGNCRWATDVEQANNTRANRLLTLGSETMPLRAWARRLGIAENTLWARLKKGWPMEKALAPALDPSVRYAGAAGPKPPPPLDEIRRRRREKQARYQARKKAGLVTPRRPAPHDRT
jgi:hypothetical protein